MRDAQVCSQSTRTAPASLHTFLFPPDLTREAPFLLPTPLASGMPPFLLGHADAHERSWRAGKAPHSTGNITQLTVSKQTCAGMGKHLCALEGLLWGERGAQCGPTSAGECEHDDVHRDCVCSSVQMSISVGACMADCVALCVFVCVCVSKVCTH